VSHAQVPFPKFLFGIRPVPTASVPKWGQSRSSAPHSDEEW
jgi:hypothetical protein